jgi:hypothetical protein
MFDAAVAPSYNENENAKLVKPTTKTIGMVKETIRREIG